MILLQLLFVGVLFRMADFWRVSFRCWPNFICYIIVTQELTCGCDIIVTQEFAAQQMRHDEAMEREQRVLKQVSALIVRYNNVTPEAGDGPHCALQ
jgi:hypothetical protein